METNKYIKLFLAFVSLFWCLVELQLGRILKINHFKAKDIKYLVIDPKTATKKATRTLIHEDINIQTHVDMALNKQKERRKNCKIRTKQKKYDTFRINVIYGC